MGQLVIVLVCCRRFLSILAGLRMRISHPAVICQETQNMNNLGHEHPTSSGGFLTFKHHSSGLMIFLHLPTQYFEEKQKKGKRSYQQNNPLHMAQD